MANIAPAAVVTQVTGRAWIRNSDGFLTELHPGSKIPAGSEIVTASGASVILQVENGMPVVIGESRDVYYDTEMTAQADPSDAAVTPPQGTDSERLLAALEAGQDPFEQLLDPTAAVVGGVTGGGGDGAGSSFTRLARILESTTPLGLAYPNPGIPERNISTAAAGTGAEDQFDTTPENTAPGANTPATPSTDLPPLTPLNSAPVAQNDQGRTTQTVSLSGNVLTNDSDADGDILTVTTVNGLPVTAGGTTVPGSAGGTFTLNPDGSYSFNPGSGYISLGQGQTAVTTVSYTITDPSGQTATATLQVTIVGTNDAPELVPGVVLGDQVSVDGTEIAPIDVSGRFRDVDTGDTLLFSATGLPPGLSIDPATGVITGLLDNSASQGGPASNGIYTVVVTAHDSFGATITQQFQWDVSNPAPIAINDVNVTDEDTTITVSDRASGVLANDRDPDGDTLRVSAVNGSPASVGGVVAGNGGGTFVLNADGTYSFNPGNDFQSLVNGESRTSSITYTITDGEGGFSQATLTVNINGVDDKAVITPALPGGDAGVVQEDVTYAADGKLNIVDPDAGQAVFVPQTNAAGQYGQFSITTDGKWIYGLNNINPAVQALGVGEQLTERFTVVSADGTTHVVNVTILGTNDVPAIAGAHIGSVTEDGVQTALGQLTVSDVDVNDKHTWSVQGGGQGAFGALTVDVTGKWTYVLNNAAAQVLKTGETRDEVFTVRVADGHGGFATQVVTVTVHGMDDGAVITPTLPNGDKGSVTEDGQLTAGGSLAVTDPDAGQAVFVPQNNIVTAHGMFSITAAGVWTYTLNNADPAVQALGAGRTLTETREVTTADGTKANVVITINGTNDV
ncbi:MAG: retention module-containing protein, partial [Burkholderiaceae bacterium]|nr:retention module-containing protein [Burkholderiaceae bacterium]